MKKVYEVFVDHVEINVSFRGGRRDIRYNQTWTTQDIIDEYNRKTSREPWRIGFFTSIEEARKAFDEEARRAGTHLRDGQIGKLLLADIVTLEQNTYDVDEDGEEWLDQGFIVDWYAEPFTVEDDDEEEEE